jgi:hypothetical protein
MTDNEKILEGQLRECYGRVVYTHKTHEKCADILLSRHKQIKFWQIALSAIVTGGIISTLSETLPSECKVFATWFSAVCSTILLVLNSYTKDYDLGEIAQKHRQAAADIWLVREKYLSLLTDLRAGIQPLEGILKIRDALLTELHATYQGVPSTDYEAYKQAQKALKEMEDMTFSDTEIDVFLPKELRRNQ